MPYLPQGETKHTKRARLFYSRTLQVLPEIPEMFKIPKGYNNPSLSVLTHRNYLQLLQATPVRFLRIIQKTIVIPTKANHRAKLWRYGLRGLVCLRISLLPFIDEYGSSIPAFPPKTDSLSEAQSIDCLGSHAGGRLYCTQSHFSPLTA